MRAFAISLYVVSLGVVTALLGGCGGQQNPGVAPLLRSEQLAHQNHLGMKSTSTCPCLFVSNTYGNSVTVYPVSVTGNTPPIRTISGPKTKLRFPADVAVDGSGRVYVANGSNVRRLNRITVFSAMAAGNVPPIQVISGRKTRLNWVVGLAVGDSGQLYVANWGSRSITVYAPGASGNIAPIAEITSNGLQTGCPYGLALDKNLLYVSCYGGNEDSPLLVYKSDVNGFVSPVRIIGAYTNRYDRSGLHNTASIAVAGRKIYAGNRDTRDNIPPPSITEYSIHADGDVPPSRTIVGKHTKVRAPVGLAVDASGNLYVSNFNYIAVYASGKGRRPKPIRVLKGGETGLDFAEGLAIH